MVRTTDGHDVVVRVCHRPGCGFDRERWPIEAARRVGIPVAEILLVEHGVDDRGEPISLSVQRRLPGSSMWRRCDDLPDDVVELLTRQAGELLARLHAIDAPNDGPIAPDGTPGGPEMEGPENYDNLAETAVECRVGGGARHRSPRSGDRNGTHQSVRVCSRAPSTAEADSWRLARDEPVGGRLGDQRRCRLGRWRRGRPCKGLPRMGSLVQSWANEERPPARRVPKRRVVVLTMSSIFVTSVDGRLPMSVRSPQPSRWAESTRRAFGLIACNRP